MHISRLSLTNFRNYIDLSLELSPHPMIFQGDNAQGKTNLLEAIWVLTTTKSHRAANERELINRSITNEALPVARLFGTVQRSKDGITLETSLRLDKASHPEPSDDSGVVRKRTRVNGIVRRAMDVVGQANAVIFSAHDLDLIAGSPSLRRRYLDVINSQIDSRYLHCLQQYNKVLTQRNHLLNLIQQRQAQITQLEFWDKELVDTGSYLIEQRTRLESVLNELSATIHDRLSGGEEQLRLIYMPNVGSDNTAASEIKSEFQSALQRSQSAEISRGMTLIGPHRDELRFEVNGTDMGTYGSRGQQRTIALSLRLAEASHLHDQANDPPILLLDDILSELDQARRHYLLETITSSQQVLITTTDLDHFDASFLAQAIQFRVRDGRVDRA